MRGSVEYQTAELVKSIFIKGLKKEDKIDPKNEHFKKVSSFKTMESYRAVWNNFFHYLREHWKINNAEKIESIHIVAYMDYKVEYYPSKQYLEKISAAFGKLDLALRYYTKTRYGKEVEYDFSIRQSILANARNLKLVAENYRNRAYAYPEEVIAHLTDSNHQLAATIQLEGGARVEGIGLIKKEQLRGYRFDEITKEDKGVIETKEKGGKLGDVLISIQSYKALEKRIASEKVFRIKQEKYMNDIRQSCVHIGLNPEGTHAFRWNFAQRRLLEYSKVGFTYEQSLQAVSTEMKHNRASITEHYLGG